MFTGRKWFRFRFRLKPKTKHHRMHARHQSEATEAVAGSNFMAKGGVGTLFLGGGIAFLTINERRRVKQDKLREISEGSCQEVDINTVNLKEANTKLILSTADIFTDEKLFDKTFQVSHPDAIKIKRLVRMYQVVERSEVVSTKTVDGKTVEEVKYTYSAEWSPRPEKFKNASAPHTKNPEFPSWLPPGPASFLPKNFYFGKQKVLLSDELINQVNDYETLLLIGIENPDKSKQTCLYNGKDFSIERQGEILYTKGKNPRTPAVGDILVNYDFVPKGEHTIVSKFDNYKKILVPLEAKLDKPLAQEGEIKAPEEVKKLTGGEPLIIPPWLIEAAEQWVLNIAPLQICWTKRGKFSKEESFAFIQKRDEENTETLRYIGSAAVCIGAIGIMSLLPIGGAAAAGSGLIIGIGVAMQTIKDATADVAGKPVEVKIKK